MKNTAELLSPAGDYKCFAAAINAGADAVYLSGNRFGARAYAANFSDEELLKAIDHAHIFGRRVYLTVNTLLKDNEIPYLYDFLAPLYIAGLDAVIVQDIGVISYIRHYFPDLPIHASTQMTVTDAEGVRLLKDLGVKRVVLSRELSLDEIVRIYKETSMDLECFIHGALCYSYSGKCLFSSLIGGRSGNRGRCAQPCRLPYDNEYILSARDICTLKMIPQLMDAGIASFKIEGRMKSPEYVAGVTGIYRKYMDLFGEDDPDRISVLSSSEFKKDAELLLKLYTRSGNCSGYYHQRNGRDMISMERPGYQKADDDELIECFNKYAGSAPLKKVNAEVNIKTMEKAALSLAGNGIFVTVCGNTADKAANRPLSADIVRKQITKTGGTFLEIDKLDISISDDAFMPVSALNELRRRAIEEYIKACLAPLRRKISPYREYAPDKSVCSHDKKINCHISKPCQLEAALGSPLTDIISVPAHILGSRQRFDEVFSLIKRNKKDMGLILPYVIRDAYFSLNPWIGELLFDNVPDLVAVDNYEALYYVKKCGYRGRIVSDIHLYALNAYAVDILRKLGITDICVPVELNRKELLSFSASFDELIIYGKLPMMISAQCVSCTRKGCTRSKELTRLHDRYGTVFECVNECSECFNIIYNSVPLSLHDELDLTDRLNISLIRIQLTTETADEARHVLDHFDKLMHIKGKDKDFPAPCRYHTKGHLNRGVK